MDTSGNLTQTGFIYPYIADISQNEYTNVLFIDNRVPSYQTFVDSVNPKTFPIVYSTDCCGNELTELLRSQFTTIDRIGFCFVSPGNNPTQFLDNEPMFSLENAEIETDNVRLVTYIINEFSIKHIDFLACDTLNYPVWQTYYNVLTKSTGVIVGASDNKTGNLKYGGDWIMESSAEDIEIVYFTKSIEYYSYLLDDLQWLNLGNRQLFSIVTDTQYIYVNEFGSNNIIQVNLTNKTYIIDWVTLTIGQSFSMTILNGIIYGVSSNLNSIFTVNTTTKLVNNSWLTPTGLTPATFSIPRGIYTDNIDTLYVSDTFNTRIIKILVSTQTVSLFVSTPGFNPYQIVTYNGNLYVSSSEAGDNFRRYSLSNPTTDNSLNFTANGTSISCHRYAPGNFVKNGYLYFVKNSSNRYISKLNLNNLSDVLYTFIDTGSTNYNGFAYSESENSIYRVSGIGALPFKGNISVFNLPFEPSVPSASITFNKTNTQSVGIGNLKVVIADPTNVALNDVYYWYSINNNSYANTFIKANQSLSPYTFYIPSITDISNTIYVKGINTLGNSDPPAALSVIVYQQPSVPPIFDVSCVGGGNIQVTVGESGQILPNYYYLNNVSYSAYLFTGGTNQSGNLSYYTANVGVLANTNTVYANVISYISGLSANTYTVYLVAKNAFGNSLPTTINKTLFVYSAPTNAPTIDTGNTLPSSPGTLTVTINDTLNDPLNGNIFYSYYVYDGSGTNDFANTLTYNNTSANLVPGTIRYSFPITGLLNKTYSVYVRANNQYGVSANSAPYNVTVFTTPTSISFNTGNTTIVTPGNLKVTVNDTTNVASNRIYYFYSTDGGATYANSTVPNNGPATTTYTFYVNYNPTAIQPIYVKAQNFLGNSNTIGLNLYSPYNTSLYTTSNLQLQSGITNYSFPLSNLTNKVYPVYLRSKNVTGYSANSSPYNVTVYTTPLATVSFDKGNTKTVASGNLQVRLVDLSNTALNEVYYQYSINGNAYISSGVSSGTSPYTFYIAPTNPILDISNTIYIKATNIVGNSSPEANLQVIVFQTPRQPPLVTFELVQSGNVRVTIVESAVPPIPYYYLNNVSYSLYAYNTIGGNNLSGNTSLSVYSRSVGILSNTNATYGNVVSYINTGLTANTYTMYVIGTNPVGNSTPFSANIVVYTTPDFPPKIDTTNTISSTSGNLTVSFTDPSNNTRNAISYWYYVYDPSTGTNNAGNVLVYSTSNTTLTTGAQQSFQLSGFVNKTYTLYLLSKNPVGTSTSSFANVTVYTVPTDISIDLDYTITISSGNLQVRVVDPSNGTNNGVYYQYSIGATGYTTAANIQTISSTVSQFVIPNLPNGSFSINVIAKNTVGNSNPTTFVQVSYTTPEFAPVIVPSGTLSQTSGNLTVTLTDVSNVALNNVSYMYYVYDISAGGTNDFANTLAYKNSSVKLLDGITQYSFPITNLSNKTYTLYLRSKNTVGYSGNSTPYNVIVYTTPFATVSFDTGNTKTIASGNLQVRLVDPSNTAFNGVYYQYSINGNAYIRSNINAGVSPYTFYISPTNPILDISNTIYIKATNQVGNSSPEAILPIIVYQRPRQPPLVTFELVQSGNVQVSINELAVPPIPYYYLNNVSYYLYAYNNANGNNLAGNTSLSIYNRSVGILSNTNATYGNIVSYINTGLTANTYTMYLIGVNSFGNSTPFSENIVVYTTPIVPTIDTNNTKSTTSGNLTVSIIDSSNSSTNGLYYLYSTDGITYGNSRVAPNGNTTYTFTINNTGNAQIPLVGNTYSLYIKLTNPIGTAIATLASVNVYTTPIVPTIDTNNTKSTTSGNLTVSIIDSSNSSTNGLYYLYSTDGITYGNSRVAPNGNTTYTFTINNTGNAQIPLVGNTYSLYIKLTNPTGNAIATLASVNVYTTPDFPPKIDTTNTVSATSGNLTVSFTDPSNNPKNVISYWYYLYDPSGDNNSGNALVYSNTGTILTTGAQQSFLLTGYINKTYTLYLLSKNPIGYSTSTYANVTIYTVPTNILIDSANTYSVSSGNLQVVLVDPANGTNNGVYYRYSINGINSNAFANASAQSIGGPSNSYRFYISDLSNATYTINVVAQNTVGTSNANTFVKTVYTLPSAPVIDQANTFSQTSGNLTVSFNDTTNAVLNDISYSYYLYDVSFGGTNEYANPLSYIESPIKLINGTTQYSFPITNLSNKTYTLYLRSKNAVGYSANSAAYNVIVFTTPFATVSFDAGNTITVASGNLQVSLVDPSNVALNQVYYWYSTTTDTSSAYANSYVKSGVLPYRFTISPPTNPLLDISSTIYIKATNTVGNSSPAISRQVVVYRTPRTPPAVLFQLVSSGNVQVTIIETPDSRPNYYYLNNVSYSLYAYNTNNDNGTNVSANLSAYSYNVGALPTTDATYGNVVSYVNTGLTANTYTMYVKAVNAFGNSAPFSANIAVYTTPLQPTINTNTTISASSGNLTVSITDTVNNIYNGIGYLYYMYDPSAVLNDAGNVAAYTESGKGLSSVTQTFTIYGYTNKTYTLYVLAKNPIGNSAPDSKSVVVYTIPQTPTSYDNANITTVASGNLQVSFFDTSNPALNEIYYWYSSNNGVTYSNTFVKNTGTATAYSFFISSLGNIQTAISLRATNTVGNSAPLTQTFTVLQTPRAPPEVTAQLIQSGNVLLNVRESATTPPANYYLNAVSYYYYLYTSGSGTNQSGNVDVYTNLIGSTTDAGYPDQSVYVTGLPNKTNTFYVIAKNAIGNSAPVSADITVYVAPDSPPAIDAGNTYSVASGNLQVRLIDNTNTTSNNVYYWYSIDGGNTYYNTNIKNNGPTEVEYTFYIPDLSNQDYTVSVISKNTVGSSSANTITKRVYVTPQFAPVIDTETTLSYSANQLTVVLADTSNNPANNIRYLYYLYDQSTNPSTNQSANPEYYTESHISLLENGTTTYTFDVSGLSNTTYTLYLLSKNTVGISSSIYTDVVVYTIPSIPSIDTENTLSVASGNLRVTVVDTSNIALNSVYYWYSINGGNTYANTNIKNDGAIGSPYVFYIPDLLNQTYTLSVMAKNTVGNVVSDLAEVVSYTTPFPVSFDDGNTLSVASGNLRVTMVDTSNIALNSVYYWYSIDGGIVYSNTNIKNDGAIGSPYVFYIPRLSNQSYTVSVKGINSVDSSTVSSITKMVYITPQYSPVFDTANTISSTSGNITVAFDDVLNNPTNNIQYWYYLYDPSVGLNEWDNTDAYIDTNQALVIDGTGPTHFTFGLSGLTNKTYTLYLLAKNPVNTSAPVYANVVVYTIPANPPTIDAANTRTAATGNLLVSFADTLNRSLNDIYYWYSTDDGTTYANSFVKNAGPEQTDYSFYIPGLTNANTSLSIRSQNTVGNSAPTTGVVKVYTTPLSIQTIDTGNTLTVATGNLQVAFSDNQNIATNDVYYWYSTYSSVDGESVFANSFVKNAGPSQSKYAFYINGLTNSHTAVSIKARNATDLYIGESATISANVIVYTTPVSLASYSVISRVSGNIQIDVADPDNVPTNEVYYYVYYYRQGDTGANNSADIAVYANTNTKRVDSTSATTFYLNDLSNNQYTVYVAAKNSVGSHIYVPALPPVQVYTVPLTPAIDNANTLSPSSGNLTVTILDTVNRSTNSVYYWYSVDGIEYGNTGITTTSGVSLYSYNIPYTQISNGNVYSVRIKTVNPVGESPGVATANPKEVFTTPEIPVLYSVLAQDTAIDITFSTPYNSGNAIARYEYILNDTVTGVLSHTTILDTNSARIAGLVNGTSYSVGVRAVNARGPSGWSSPRQTTIPYGVPFRPDTVIVTPGDKSLEITFSTPNNNGNDIVRYEYSLYSGSLGQPIRVIDLSYNNQYTVTGLTNGITYNVVVRAVNARGVGQWSVVRPATPYTRPDAPVINAESLPGSFRVYFETPYDGGAAITDYQYTLNNGDTYTSFGISNSVVIPGTDGETYTVSVRTWNINGRVSDLSAPVSVIPFRVPDSPILQTAEPGIAAISIAFSPPADNGGNTITRYEYSTNNGNTFVSAGVGIPTTIDGNGYITYEIIYQSTGVGATELVNGTAYTVRLRAVNARGPSASSAESITVIPYNRPDPPTMISATPKDHMIDISFLAPVSNGGNPITKYEYTINGGVEYIEMGNLNVSAQQFEYTITGLENGNVFSVSVRSRNTRGASAGSNSISAIPFGIPDPPTIIGNPENARLEISFDTPNRRGNAIVGYEYSVNSGVYKRISPILPMNDMSQNTFMIYGVTNGQSYTVTLRAVNGVGLSGNSNVVTLTPSTLPAAPTIQTVIPLPGAIDIVFNTVTNTGGNTITGYKYAYYLGGL